MNQIKTCSQASLQEIYKQNWPETTKDYFSLSNSTLLYKLLTFI